MRSLVWPALLALVVAACGGNTVNATLTAIGSEAPTPTATLAPTLSPSPSPSPSPTPTPIADASAGGTPSPTPSLAAASPWPACINGWINPPPGEPLYEEGVLILANYMGLPDPFNVDPLNVDDMRYFVGPDPDWILAPRFEAVEHWYIKATLSSDPTYRGRWLIEKRDEQRLGVSAVAPYDTVGYNSPDWSGFVGEGAPRAIDGLPGLWSGIQYDFVTGEGDSGNPGLDESLAECMATT